jgi:hypothetical protein
MIELTSVFRPRDETLCVLIARPFDQSANAPGVFQCGGHPQWIPQGIRRGILWGLPGDPPGNPPGDPYPSACDSCGVRLGLYPSAHMPNFLPRRCADWTDDKAPCQLFFSTSMPHHTRHVLRALECACTPEDATSNICYPTYCLTISVSPRSGLRERTGR